MSFESENRSSPCSPLQALQAALRPVAASVPARSGLLVAGATGVLGGEVLRQLAGSGAYAQTRVLAREPITTGLSQVGIELLPSEHIDDWPLCTVAVQTGVVMFEPPRLYHDRERALWTPTPGQLVPLAQWLRRCGVQTLVVVLPHAQGSLPAALRHGLANLDEQALVALGFERVLLVRSARKQSGAAVTGFFQKTARWMLSAVSYMIPANSLPVRPARLAEFVAAALRILPAGTHVADPELLSRAAQARDMQAVLQAWLNTTRPHARAD